MFKKIMYSLVIAMLVSTLALGAEVRKLGEYDLSWGPYGTTWTSPAGKVVRYLPRYFSTDAFLDNLTLYGKGFTGDNTGRLQDMSIGSAGYTDNGYFGDLITKGPWVDVRAFGAVGDNSTNNAVAIQATIDAVAARTGGSALDDQGIGLTGLAAVGKKGAVFIPYGIFRFGQTLTVPPGVAIIGEGFGSELMFTGTGVAIQTTKNTFNYLFRDFSIQASGNNGTVGLLIQNNYHVIVDHVYVYGNGIGFSTAGVRVNGDGTGLVNSAAVTIKDSYIQVNAGHGILLDGDGAGAIINIKNNRIQQNTGVGIRQIKTVYSYAPVNIDGNDVEGNTGGGISLDAVNSSSITNNYAEMSSAVSPIKVCGGTGGCIGVTIRNNNLGVSGGDNCIDLTGTLNGGEVSGNVCGGATYAVRLGNMNNSNIIGNIVTYASVPAYSYAPPAGADSPANLWLQHKESGQAYNNSYFVHMANWVYSGIKLKSNASFRGSMPAAPGSTGNNLLGNDNYNGINEFEVGDIIFNSAPVDNGYVGWVCTYAGQSHNAATGNITSGSDNVTSFASPAGWTVGDKIMTFTDALGIAAGTTIIAKGANWAQLSSPATDNATGISLYGARFKGFGQIQP